MNSAVGSGFQGMPWPSWIEVDLDSIAHNVAAIRRVTGDGCRIIAVVKAQAYGHGATEVSRAALSAGAQWLAVSRVREGAQLRAAGLDAPILLLGSFDRNEVPQIVRLGLRPTVVSPEQVGWLCEAAEGAGATVQVHLKIDTGLGRYGAPIGELRGLLSLLSRAPAVRVEGLYSHFASADDSDLSYARAQLGAMKQARAALESEGYSFPVAHIAASAGVLALGSSQMEMVRLGLSMYGHYPSPHLRSVVDLRPALSLKSRVSRLFRVERGQSIGYGRTFVAQGPISAALVPVGYADGLPRAHGNRGAVLVRGRRAPIIGRISMDQSVVDVTSVAGVAVGDTVTLIGDQEGATISCEEFAALSGTINYETLTSLGWRLPRVYLRGGKPVSVAYLDEGRVESWTQ